MSPDEYLLTNPVGYTPNTETYAEWLACGLEASEKLNSGEANLENVDTTAATGNVMQIEMDYHVDWSFSANKISDTEYELDGVGVLDEGWHTYSQFLTGFDGPLPTMFTFEESDNFEIIGDIQEVGSHTYFDSVWECEIIEFNGKAKFKANVKVNTTEKFTIKGFVSYMVCEDGQCLPPTDEPFEVIINE